MDNNENEEVLKSPRLVSESGNLGCYWITFICSSVHTRLILPNASISFDSDTRTYPLFMFSSISVLVFSYIAFHCVPNSVNSGYADKSWLSKMPGRVFYLPTSFFHFLCAWMRQWTCTLNYGFLLSSGCMKLWYSFVFNLIITSFPGAGNK